LFASELARELPLSATVLPTVLKAKKKEVHSDNLHHLQNLNTKDGKEIVSLTSVDEKEDLDEFCSPRRLERYESICREFFEKDCPAANIFEFAEGAQVHPITQIHNHTITTMPQLSRANSIALPR
jgi:hypothetical protein